VKSGRVFFYPRETRAATGTLPTKKEFTEYRQDSAGLYYYATRYYNPAIFRFIRPDTIMPDSLNLRSLDRKVTIADDNQRMLISGKYDISILTSGSSSGHFLTRDQVQPKKVVHLVK
jgi:RHS repeat-associated protein